MIDKFITVLFIQTVFTWDKFCWRCVWRYVFCGQNLTSRGKPSALIKCWWWHKFVSINKFFAGAERLDPVTYKAQRGRFCGIFILRMRNFAGSIFSGLKWSKIPLGSYSIGIFCSNKRLLIWKNNLFQLLVWERFVGSAFFGLILAFYPRDFMWKALKPPGLAGSPNHSGFLNNL